MEIKDLAGLSEPLTKLIDVCSKGLGNVSEPYLIKKRAEAKAYEIETITKALHAQKEIGLLPHTAYSNGELEIIADPNQSVSNDFALIQNEILERKYFQEIKKQGNINNTINFTINELENETEVSEEKVDEDWITRFFNTIENISNEQLQQLWAKILAGEIKQPNTYSLRTLDVLKNLSFKEAEAFSKVGIFAFTYNNDSMIMADDNLLKQFNITFTDLLVLQDLNLIHPNILQWSHKKVEEEAVSHLIQGNQLIQIARDQTSPIINLTVYKFTPIGQELLSLIEPELNKKYIQEVAKKFKVHASIKTSTCTMFNNKQYNPKELVEI